jgi:hypothetical protein
MKRLAIGEPFHLILVTGRASQLPGVTSSTVAHEVHGACRKSFVDVLNEFTHLKGTTYPLGQERLQVFSAGIAAHDRCERLHDLAFIGRIEARVFNEVRELLVVVRLHKERLGRNTVGQDHFVSVEHNVEIFKHVPVGKSGSNG